MNEKSLERVRSGQEIEQGDSDSPQDTEIIADPEHINFNLESSRSRKKRGKGSVIPLLKIPKGQKGSKISHRFSKNEEEKKEEGDVNANPDMLSARTFRMRVEDDYDEKNEFYEGSNKLDLNSNEDRVSQKGIPLRLIVCTIILDILGLTYLACLIAFWKKSNLERNMVFAFLCVLFWLPGIYYTVEICYYCSLKDGDRRKEAILRDINN